MFHDFRVARRFSIPANRDRPLHAQLIICPNGARNLKNDGLPKSGGADSGFHSFVVAKCLPTFQLPRKREGQENRVGFPLERVRRPDAGKGKLTPLRGRYRKQRTGDFWELRLPAPRRFSVSVLRVIQEQSGRRTSLTSRFAEVVESLGRSHAMRATVR